MGPPILGEDPAEARKVTNVSRNEAAPLLGRPDQLDVIIQAISSNLVRANRVESTFARSTGHPLGQVLVKEEAEDDGLPV